MYHKIENDRTITSFSLEDLNNGHIDIGVDDLIRKNDGITTTAFEIDEIKELIIRNFEANAFEITLDNILSHTCQFFKINDKGHPYALGSGVFIEIENDFYLITAAHVWDEDDIFVWYENIRLDINKETYPKYFKSPIKNGNRIADTIDIAVVDIPKEYALLLQNEFEVHFLPYSNIETNYSADSNEEIPSLVVCGFAATKSKWNSQHKSMTTIPFLLRTSPKEINKDLYQLKGYKKHENIFLSWSKKKIMHKKHLTNEIEMRKSPNPEGISGGGVWSIRERKTFEDMKKMGYEYHLVAILIEYNPRPKSENEKYMAATVIDYATECLRIGRGKNIERSELIDIAVQDSE